MRVAGFAIRLTAGAYLLATLAVVVSTLNLRAAAPGWPAGAYAAATAGVVVVVLGSLIGHELAHALAARHHGADSHRDLDRLLRQHHAWQVRPAGPRVLSGTPPPRDLLPASRPLGSAWPSQPGSQRWAQGS